MSDNRVLSPGEAALRHCLDIPADKLERVRVDEERYAAEHEPPPPVEILKARQIRVEAPGFAQWPSWQTNPCITEHDGKLLVAVRQVEQGHDWHYRRSRTVIGRVGQEWRTIDWHVVDEGPHAEGLILEDTRIISVDGKLMGCASVRKYADANRSTFAVVEFNDVYDIVRMMAQPSNAPREKNWSPVVTGDTSGERLGFVHTIGGDRVAPIVVRYNAATGFVSPSSATLPPLPDGCPRGGSQLVPYRRGWLSVVHEVRTNRVGMPEYVHRFAFFTEGFASVRLGARWRFAPRTRIEFCAGIARVGHGYVLSFGVEDVEPRLALVEPETVEMML